MNSNKTNPFTPSKAMADMTADLINKQSIYSMKTLMENVAKEATGVFVHPASNLSKYDCPECGTGPLDPHKLTCPLYPRPGIGDAKKAHLSWALQAANRMSRVVANPIKVTVSIPHPVGMGPPSESIMREAKRRLYRQGRMTIPGPGGKPYRPWGKPELRLSRDMGNPIGNTIQVTAVWKRSVDLSRPDPHRKLRKRKEAKAYPTTVCNCEPCRDWHQTPDSKGGCFVDEKGHGKCIDTFDQECICSGTAADGECEGCWLWLK